MENLIFVSRERLPLDSSPLPPCPGTPGVHAAPLYLPELPILLKITEWQGRHGFGDWLLPTEKLLPQTGPSVCGVIPLLISPPGLCPVPRWGVPDKRGSNEQVEGTSQVSWPKITL